MKYFITIFKGLVTLQDQDGNQISEASSYVDTLKEKNAAVNACKEYLTAKEWAEVTIEVKY
jgi:hypothetical protein